jgi:hypothetical protein
LLTFASRDDDGDTYLINAPGSNCGQETLPANLKSNATSESLEDCDDANNGRWRRMAIYRDADGDDVGSGAALRQCMGDLPPSGYSLTGYDPLDDPNNSAAPLITTLVLDGWLLAVPDVTEDEDNFP